MEISDLITNEISGLNKAKVSSAVISKRSLLHPGGKNPNTLSINSPLITNRGFNNMISSNKEGSEVKQAYTPALPSRSKQFNFSSPGQVSMNKFFRSDDGDKPEKKEKEEPKIPMFRTLDRGKKEIAKPPLPLERKEIEIRKIPDKKPSEKDSLVRKLPHNTPLSEGKNNTTMETTPEIKQVGFMRKLPSKEEEKKENRKSQKFEDNLKAFNEYKLPEETSQMIDRKKSTLTPGLNKRRLTRKENKKIDPIKSSKTSKGSANDLTMYKMKSKEDRAANVSDPLMKFSKNKPERTNTMQESFSMLQMLGNGVGGTPNIKDEKTFELFTIPDFKPKDKPKEEIKEETKEEEKEEKKEEIEDKPMIRKFPPIEVESKPERVELRPPPQPVMNPRRNIRDRPKGRQMQIPVVTVTQPAIPKISGYKFKRDDSSDEESIERAPTPELKQSASDKVENNFERTLEEIKKDVNSRSKTQFRDRFNSLTPDSELAKRRTEFQKSDKKKKNMLDMRKIYSKGRDKILSVIQEEENKNYLDYLPTAEPKKSPYFENLLLGKEKNVVSYSNRSHQSIINNQESQKLLTRMLKYNEFLKEYYKDAKLEGKKKIDWRALNQAKQSYKLLIE